MPFGLDLEVLIEAKRQKPALVGEAVAEVEEGEERVECKQCSALLTLGDSFF